MNTWTGQPIDRVEARLKVTGKAVYSADVGVANVTHAAIVGSTISKGKIVSIDTKAAQKLPGVLSIVTHENAPKIEQGGEGDRVLQLLQDD
jgi:xanthine dehydrogenase YagR molybdenum-binding subunit